MTLLLLIGLALAEEPSASPAPASDAAPAAICPDPTPALIDALRLKESREAWLCLSERDEAGPALLAAVEAGGAGSERVGRALALWRMQRLDERIPDGEARALSAADRRLLRDAVHARRGRASPAPEHAEIFAWFAWYKPDPRYLASRLDALDKENMAVLDAPPPPPPPAPPASAAMAEAAPAAPSPVETGFCGCTTGAASPGLLAVALAAAGLRARRRGALTRR